MQASLWTNSLSKNTHKYIMPLILESGLWMGFFFIGMCAHIWQIPKPEQCASGQHWRHGVHQHPQIAGWVNPEAGLRDTMRKVCYWDTLERSCMWRRDMSKNIYQKVKSGAAPIKSLPKKWMSPFWPSLWWINKAVKSTPWVWCINNFLHPFWHSYAINWLSHHMFTLEKLALRQSNKTEICFFSPTNRARIGWFGKFKWNQISILPATDLASCVWSWSCHIHWLSDCPMPGSLWLVAEAPWHGIWISNLLQNQQSTRTP